MSILHTLHAAIGNRLDFDLELAALHLGDNDTNVERSARDDFGDYSTAVCLSLARKLRRPPLTLAQSLADALDTLTVPATVTVTPPGYVNITLNRPAYFRSLLSEIASARTAYGTVPAAARTKVIIEHTSVNANKAAHIGHLRNATIGDTMGRVLRRTGHEVEIHNYIDDTGVQVADVVVALQHLPLQQRPDEPFDRFCSRAYVAVSRRYETDPELLEERRKVLRAIEDGESEKARFSKDVATRIVHAHLATMARIGVAYDLLTWESDILAGGFWTSTFAALREAGVIVFHDTGPYAGCWVVPLGGQGAQEDGGDIADAANEEVSDAKILVKSDGVATYTAKDTAYHLWKFGLEKFDFSYRVWSNGDRRGRLWTTTSPENGEARAPGFGRANAVINVIDVRQSYLQAILRDCLAGLGYDQAAANLHHLVYEVVALSREAAVQLGVDVSDGKELYALSGRRGIEVQADRLLDMVEQKLAEKSDRSVAAQLATGVVRYYLLRSGLDQTIAFDFEDALRANGETGIYLQYAYSRACSLLKRSEAGEAIVVPAEGQYTPDDREWALLREMGEFPWYVDITARRMAPVMLARYAHRLAKAFTDFYEGTSPIYRLPDGDEKRWKLALVAGFRQVMGNTLDTLGIPALAAI